LGGKARYGRALSRWQGHKPLSHVEIRKIAFGIILAMYLGALDQTIVATALPTIGRRFGEIGNLSRVVTAYLLTSTAVTPLYGKLSDMHAVAIGLNAHVGDAKADHAAAAALPEDDESAVALLGRDLLQLGDKILERYWNDHASMYGIARQRQTEL
jgi:hypothetical protein